MKSVDYSRIKPVYVFLINKMKILNKKYSNCFFLPLFSFFVYYYIISFELLGRSEIAQKELFQNVNAGCFVKYYSKLY